jgi:hypothetical protein
MHSKTTHIPIKYHLLQEHAIEKNMKLEYIGTKENIAYILTKQIAREPFEYLQHKIGLVDSP